MKRGRPSASDRSALVLHIGKPVPPEPSPDLTPEQAVLWRNTLAALPGDWVEPAALPVLAELCRRVCRARLLEGQVRDFDPEWIQQHAGGIERFDRLLAMADRETKAVIACCRALRLTPSAVMHPRVAGRRLANTPIGPTPWDDRS
jgi:hypothetical protein